MRPAQNHLIDQLPGPERGRMLARCETVHWRLGEVLCRRGEPLTHVYFPTQGFVALLAEVDQHPGPEVGMIGHEGMVGAWLLLGVHTVPLRTLVQGVGAAWRIERSAFCLELQRSTALQAELGRYLYLQMAQMAACAACQRLHLLAPRLARWLLMSQDRAGEDRFHVTHEFLALMLGVRRVGVTTAAVGFQRAGLIRYHRGELTVLDREGLLAASCSCYGEALRLAHDLSVQPKTW